MNCWRPWLARPQRLNQITQTIELRASNADTLTADGAPSGGNSARQKIGSRCRSRFGASNSGRGRAKQISEPLPNAGQTFQRNQRFTNSLDGLIMSKFEKGTSGNPGGRPGGLGRIRDIAQQHTENAIETLVRILNSETASPAR